MFVVLIFKAKCVNYYAFCMYNTAQPISTADTAYTVFTTVVLLTKFHPYFENFVQSGGRWPTQVRIVKSCPVGRQVSTHMAKDKGQ